MDESPPSLVVAVAGMHRSGTSMFARFLHHAGIFMGEELHVDTVTNPYGHYEDLGFLELQRQELARAFAGEDYLVAADFAPSPEFLAGARELVRRRREHHCGRPWGWKDPRTTLFLSEWQALVPGLRVVALLRSPRPVLDSLCRRLRAQWSVQRKDHLLRTYAHYNETLAGFRDRHPTQTLVLSLEELVSDPTPHLAVASEFLEHPLPPELFRELFDARAMSRSRRTVVLFNRSALRTARAARDRLWPHRSQLPGGRGPKSRPGTAGSRTPPADPSDRSAARP